VALGGKRVGELREGLDGLRRAIDAELNAG